jgi:hypothetical protein
MVGDPPNCWSCIYKSPQQFQSIPHCCPVCNGKGNVPQGFYNMNDSAPSTCTNPEICKSCYGSGILWR